MTTFMKSLLNSISSALNALFSLDAAKASLVEAACVQTVDPILEIQVRIPGGELVNFSYGIERFGTIAFEEGDTFGEDDADQIGCDYITVRTFSGVGEVKVGMFIPNDTVERPDRWCALIACILTNHGGLPYDYRHLAHHNQGEYSGPHGCVCGECESTPLMELAKQFASREMWREVEQANGAMEVLQTALAGQHLDSWTNAARAAFLKRNQLSTLLNEVIYEEQQQEFQRKLEAMRRSA